MSQDEFNSPDLLKLEAAREEVLNNTTSFTSRTVRLFQYLNFFNQVFSANNKITTESFLTEFLLDYISCLSSYSVCGIKPELTIELIVQVDRIISTGLFPEQNEQLGNQIERVNQDFERLNKILDGNEPEESKISKASFPLIEQSIEYGIIDSITVKIEKGSKENKFIIVPSEKKTDKDLSEQIQISWQLAIDSVKRYVKTLYPHHEVIISFDRKEGIYRGNSLGAALTLSFIHQVLAFYNPACNINLQNNIAFTGGIDRKGYMIRTNSEIIKQKVSVVFYSEIQTFIIPKDNEEDAELKLKELKQIHPKKHISLLAVKNLSDILDRRTIVDIKRINPIKRTGKFVKKNWISAIVTVLLAILFAYLFAMDFDYNPAALTTDGSTYFIKNKNGKIIWTKSLTPINPKFIDKNYLNCLARIIDIDEDGLNEVLIINERINNQPSDESIRCYSENGDLVWKYVFKEEVYSQREKLPIEYGIRIIDTLTLNTQKSLVLFSSNGPSFSSVVHRIDLKSGLKLPGSFWASGHISGGMIRDTNNDGKPELIGLGFDNGYEDVVFFEYGIDTTNKVRPTTDEYLIRNYPKAEMKSYLRFPKTDFDIYYHQRTPKLDYEVPTYIIEQNEYRFNFNRFQDDNASSICFHISEDFKEVTPFIESRFRVLRDSLVAEGKIQGPYTDTKEYKEILKNNILYLKDGKWVKRVELN